MDAYQGTTTLSTTGQTDDMEVLYIYDEIAGKDGRAYAFDLEKHDVIQANFSESTIELDFKVIDPLGNEIKHAYVDYNTIIFVAWTDGRYIIQVLNPETTTAIFNATVYKIKATETIAGTITKPLDPGEYVGYYIDFNKTSQASISLTGTYGTDYNMYIFDSEGNLHAYSERTEYPDEVDFAVLYPEPYYIIVYAKRGKETGSIGLNIIITDPYTLDIDSTATEEITNPTSTIIYKINTTSNAIYKIYLTTPNSYINKTVFSDDLESDVSNWEIQGNWTLMESDYHSETHCWNVNGTETSILITPPIDLTIAKGGVAKLVFWQKQNIYSSYYYYVDVSKDGGLTWTTILTIDYNSSTWQKKEISLSDYFGEKIKIRFRYSGTSISYWRIDDITVIVTYGATTLKIYNENLSLKYTIDTTYQEYTYGSYVKYFVSPAYETYYLLISSLNATDYELTVTK